MSTGAVTRAIEVSIGDLAGPTFAAKAVRVALDGAGLAHARLQIGELTVFDRRWRDVEISCTAFRLEPSIIACDEGRLERPVALPIAFRHDASSGSTRIAVSPGGEERWTVEASGSDTRRVVVRAEAAAAARVHLLFPDLPVRIGGGVVDGTLRVEIPDTGDMQVDGEMRVRAGAFADAAGLHAGEGIVGRAALHAQGRGESWRWHSEEEWSQGEVFWSPVYSKAGFRLTAEGRFDAQTIEVANATLSMDDVGEIRASATIDRQSQEIVRASVETGELAVTPLYTRFLQPALAQTALGELRTEGRLRASMRWQNGKLTQAALDLEDVSAEDLRGRFALFGVYASLPWQAGGRTEGRIGMSGAEVQRLPLGAVGTFLDIRPEEVFIDDFAVPVLSGLLTLNDLHLRREADGIAWGVRAALTPVPLAEMLAHFGLPAMQGTLSGEIPLVRYAQSTLAVDGALTIRVFDGTVKVTDLVVDSPLGLAPRMSADLEAHNLDLALVTRAYSFGDITGRLDARIADLVLSDWKPVRFDARLASSPGDYPRRISQTAVENISALGGAGAAVAVQRSVLRFFESFGYSKLGISCRLREGVCRMGGIEDTPQGFMIVKGGGVPAINVLGYNRDVGWDELLTRLRRVIDSNVTPTIQ
ncbi:MAG: YdbH domain-containing protein [Betaproteobacteria bacterium]|jgi:hypothetical protein|nr:YdbH domain-containing protein [Betaproteobacteria bacterium]